MQIDAHLISLSLDDHTTMVEYLTKFKELYTQSTSSEKNKKEYECIFLILSKLKCPFHLFDFTFCSIIYFMGDKFTMPILEELCEHIMREEIKISTLEVSSSSSKALSISHSEGKRKHKSNSNTTTPSPQQAP